MQRKKRTFLALLATCLLAIIVAVAVNATGLPRDDLLKEADELFEKKNYKDAAVAYEALLEKAPGHEKWQHASERIILCHLRLRVFDQAVERAEKYIERCAKTPFEARAERLAGNLYMLIPHWGTRAGGKFHRAQRKQGIQVRSYKYDKKHAILHMERARLLYAQYDGDAEALSPLPEKERKEWHNERIECIFDLASIYSRFGIYERGWFFWYSFWGERDEFLAETAGEEDFDEYYSDWQLQRKRPTGLRVDGQGNPIFPAAPKDYKPQLTDDQKILYLLKEARDLDETLERKYEGLGYYRQAMLARTRFGMDRLNQCAELYSAGGKYPLQEELEEHRPWELGDREALILAGGRIRRVELPKEWDVLGLLRTVVWDYPKCGIADEVLYAVGLYFQSRQQYLPALEEYEKLRKVFPGSSWKEKADEQIELIKKPEVLISQSGVQLPGEPAKIQLSFRNASKIWFVARTIDLEGFFREIRSWKEDKDSPFWILQNWHQYFVHLYTDYWPQKIAAKYIGKEAFRWVDSLQDEGTHRYKEALLQTPLRERGAFLIFAYLNEPPQEDGEREGLEVISLGQSRGVFVLTDLAIVQKKVKEGILYFICDARRGAPVSEAQVDILETWSEWDRTNRKTLYYKRMHNLKTGEGMALLHIPERNSRRLHALVKAGEDRLAWTGMGYWNPYSPSAMLSGLFAYCITDRPVYRPLQTVHFKVWVRKMENGILRNLPGEEASITVYDPRGNKAYDCSGRTDPFGGFDGQFALGEEPPLGVYRITVKNQKVMGGQNFRVEEYKKPEFEVTVEPGKEHARLGERVSATIRAVYYFGSPVTDASVHYKVFREEYTHSYHFPGEWDWLYGPGYGWSWYEHSWFPWWEGMKCCWSPPSWWRAFWGGPGFSPVRELVQQGDKAIGKDGRVLLEIDTAAALRDHPDRDHQYIIQAEVRDASRRVITGEGAVKVTRQAFYTFIQADRGYYRPGEEMVIQVRCLTPDNRPVQAEGQIVVSSVVFGGRDNARIEEEELQRWKASTDERGTLEFRLRHERSGQLKIQFSSPDEWGGIVDGYGLVWVCGRDFDGRLHRFNNIELITDKRSYQPGETAHVLINTKHPESYVLFSDEVDQNHLLSWKLLHLPRKTTLVHIPIKKEHQPDFYIEATTVAEARVHQQCARICVPPEKSILKLAVEPDKPEYGPGEQATMKIIAKTLDGKPAQAQITLSAFDRSILYIQPEYTPGIERFFHGHLRYHSVQMDTNLLEQFSAWGLLHRPFEELRFYPHAWWGTWGPGVSGWRTVSDAELNDLAQGREMKQDFRLGKGGGGRLGIEAGEDAAKPGVMQEKAGGLGGPGRGKGEELRRDRGEPGEPEEKGGPSFEEAEVRRDFADTAIWLASLTTDEDGTASVSLAMPENLTTWKINTWGMTRETTVGQQSASAVTTKNLLVRLQAPRFFMEYDEVVLSANVHNYLKKDKAVRVNLRLPGELLELMGEAPDTIDLEVPAGAERRVDWRVKVLKEGTAKIAVKALTDEESDAMEMTFPVLVHGITKQVSSTGSMRSGETKKSASVELVVPEKRRPELTRLEVQFSPSLVGAMLDALPYCIYYPYGCTEQTVSRFLPCVLTLKTLQNMGIRLEDVQKIRGRMEEIQRIKRGENLSCYWENPIFDQAELNTMIEKGLSRIADMQQSDGGWGWWTRDSSSGYLTSYVLYALLTAAECDVAVDPNLIQRGMDFLKRWEETEMNQKYWRVHSQHAFSAYVLSLKKMKAICKPPKEDARDPSLVERLWSGRDELPLYGKALLALALANLNDQVRAGVVLQNILQYKEENEETEVSWFRTQGEGWWYWWNSDIETNAWILRALVRLDPQSSVSPRLVKWLLNNRKNGYYWRSTRDTTLCVAAMSDFAEASGEGRPDYTLTLDFDNGSVVKKVKINRDNFFTYDNRFVLEGVSLEGGRHTLTITKEGPGALYFNAHLKYFSKEEHISAAGLELKVGRSYYRLSQIPYEVKVEGAGRQEIREERLRFRRDLLRDGDEVKSGDLIQVELRVTSDNNYTYLCFEDRKPAGCEPTEVRSGGKGQEGFYSYMELRDEKVVFFVNTLDQGEHLLRYRIRAEIPGIFHALPAVLYGMYVPELRANSDEQVIRIVD